MIIDVSSILNESGGKLPVCGSVSLEDMDFLGESFHFLAPMEINGYVVNNGKALKLRCSASGRMTVHCARCMKSVEVDIDFDIDEDFMQEGAEMSDEEDIIVFSGYNIEISEVVANSFFMNVPGKYLCSEDCRGLCPDCGQNLNEGECKCAEERIDPRWEALKKIMDNTEN